ncbi:MAG: cell division protein SepF [Acidimicrobiales bacterium]
MLQSLKVYLGLGPDEEYDDSYLDADGYDDYEEYDDVAPTPRNDRGYEPGPVRTTARRAAPDSESTDVIGSVRPLRPVPSADYNDEPAFPRRASSSSANLPSGFAQDSSVRPVRVERAKPRTVTPDSFGDAKTIADEFKRHTPVVMNMQGISKDLARRLIDFASGVCYVEGGSMEKLAPNVFLLTPKSVEVSDEDRRRLEERGFDRV